MRIKKGDTVLVITGKDKGKKGKIERCFSREHKVIIEGLNRVVRHRRSRRQGEKGQRVEISAPLDVSNLRLICPKCGKPTRVGYKLRKDQRKKRICKKCKQIF